MNETLLIPFVRLYHSSVFNQESSRDIYTTEHYSTLKGERVIKLFVVTWINLEDIMPSEISQAQEHKYGVISLIYGF
jgi:hypothetical protein